MVPLTATSREAEQSPALFPLWVEGIVKYWTARRGTFPRPSSCQYTTTHRLLVMPADGDHSHKRARSIDSEAPSVHMKRPRIQTARKTTGGKPPRDRRTHKAVQVGAINGASLQEGGPSLHRTRALPPSPESVSSQGGQEIASVHEEVRDSNGRELTRSQRAPEDEDEAEEEDTTEDVVPQAAQGPGRRK